MSSILEIIPGFIPCLLIALAAEYLSSFVPALGAALIAIAKMCIRDSIHLYLPILKRNKFFFSFC